MKAVIHVDLEDEARLVEALANALNLLDEEEEAEVVVVANGGVVNLLPSGRSTKLEGRVRKLHGMGVAFRVCANALKAHAVDRGALPDAWEVVPAGIVELVRLQNEGFRYVKP